MPSHDEKQHRSPRDIPPVGRPRGAVWRSLQADGVVWEGQVLLVGDDVDLAARMIVTHRRVAFVRGGDLVLDIPRDWLRPEPVLRRDGVLDLFVAMPGSNLFDEPLRVPLRMREGHPAAGHIIAMLAPGGVRRIATDSLSGMDRARETMLPRFGGFWDDDEAAPVLRIGGNGLVPAAADAGQDVASPSPDASELGWAPIEPPDHVLRVPSIPHRHPGPSAFPIAGMLPRDQRRSPWRLLLRVGAVTVLLATAAALGAGKLHIDVPGSRTEPILVAPTPTVQVTGSPTEAPAAALLPDEQTAIDIGVGGAAANNATAEETATAEAAKTAAPAGATATPGPAIAPSEPAIPTPAPTTVPAPAATSVAESSPTDTPALTTETTSASGPAAETETPAPAKATPSQTPLTQPAAVAADEPPAQEIVVGPLRLAFPIALRAESLPRYALPPGSGEWVLLVTDMTNEGDAPASLPMSDFRLFDRGTGTVADLDTGTDVIASLSGFDPAWTNSDVIAIEPGGSAKALLLYLLPPGSSDDIALIVGESSMDLAPALALGESTPADAPRLVEATVTEVLDGARIAVDIGGLREDVHYLGMEAPAAGACFATEATSANAQLVEGKQVWLERQATDRGAADALSRDLWIAGPDGDRALVAARLLEAGAGIPDVAAPDTRYQAWLEASTALARSNGAGLWSACQETAESAAASSTNAPQFAFLTGGWRERWGFAR